MRPLRIAILEPDEETRARLRRFLAILLPDSEVTEHVDVNRCMIFLYKYPVDLLLASDEANGWHILGEFPQRKRRFRAIALVDGRSDRAWRAALDAGADDVASKPVDDLVLKSKIETLVSGLYSSPYSFYGSGGDSPLAPITLGLEASVLEINESRVEVLAAAHLKSGARLRLKWGGLELDAVVEQSRPNLNRPGHFFVGAKLDIATEAQARGLRRALIAAATAASASASRTPGLP